MPRHARVLSENKIYHIVLKGINSNNIFLSDGDYKIFIKCFKNTCVEYNVEILAYCLMTNHVHFILKFNNENMPEMFKSFGAKYVPKYNYTHSKTGPLFNGRYYSSPINDDDYLFAALRYIHYNPVSAGICKRVDEYKWSSYNEYIERKGNITDTEFIGKLLSDSDFKAIHIVDDRALDEFFIMNSKINGIKQNDIIAFLDKNKDRSQDEVIDLLLRAGATKNMISKTLNISRKKL